MATPPPPPPPPSPPPLPPPPAAPVPPPNPTSSSSLTEETKHEYISKIIKSTTTLESIRSQLSEHEASIHFASTLLSHPTGLPYSTKDSSSSGVGNTNRSKNGSGGDVGSTMEEDMKKMHSFVSPSVKDGWFALLRNSSISATDKDNENSNIDDILGTTTSTSNYNNNSTTFMVQTNNVENPDLEYPLPKGQLSKATKVHALSASLQRASDIALKLKELNENNNTNTEATVAEATTTTNTSLNEIQSHIEMIQTIQSELHSKQNVSTSSSSTSPKWIMQAFQKRIRELREYHARHDTSTSITNTESMMNYSLEDMTMSLNERERYNPTTGITSKPTSTAITGNTIQSMIEQTEKRKKRRMANPSADGYDLYSILNVELQKIKNGDLFSMEEVLGKYLDFVQIHEGVISVQGLNDMFVNAMNDGDNKHKEKEEEEKKKDDNPAEMKTDNMMTKEQMTTRQENITYPDFCTLLQKGLSTSISEKSKLSSTQGTRKKYIRFLVSLQTYLISFLAKVSPLLDIEKEVIGPSMVEFDREWRKNGGVAGWECKTSERNMVSPNSSSIGTTVNTEASSEEQEKKGEMGIDLKQYKDVESLLKNVSADDLKSELSRLGMKCGGAPLDRAKRLWHTRDTPLDQLPAKLFVKKGNHKSNGNAGGQRKRKVDQVEVDNTVENDDGKNAGGAKSLIGGGNQRRVDIARLEAVVTALLDQLRPTLDATARRAERRLTQTINEKEREMEEEISGAFNSNEDEDDLTTGVEGNKKEGGKDRDDETDSEDEDAPIYNPKGVPLGWDGKPIPYWLFKLHGLNHFYTCEICGNVSYRGRHNFEKHFAEAKHSYGMRCLDIPNTKHFHGVTKIADAQNLWAKLQSTVNKDRFDGAKEEEYEDSNGNVLTRSTYEDLARQGLL